MDVIREFSTTFTMALLVALVVLLLQWNLHKRVEKLDKSFHLINAAGSDGRRNTCLEFTRRSLEA